MFLSLFRIKLGIDIYDLRINKNCNEFVVLSSWLSILFNNLIFPKILYK